MRFWKPEPIEDTRPDPVAAAHKAAMREAYARGRRDERARHRNSPVVAAAFGLAGLLGATLLVSAALRGSFEDGGRLIDNQIAAATGAYTPPARAPASFIEKPDAG